MFNARTVGRISAEELNTRIKLKSMMLYLPDRRLQWFSHLEQIENRAWLRKYRTVKVGNSFPRKQFRKTGNEVIKSDLKEKKNMKS